MPRKLGGTKEHKLAPGVYITKNSILIDYAEKEDHQAEGEENPNPTHTEEDRQHAPHENGRTEGSPKPIGE